MKPEYFPPREDIILQNEAPTDLYILVTGSVVSNFSFPGSPSLPLLLLLAVVHMCPLLFLNTVVHTKFELNPFWQELIQFKNGGEQVNQSVHNIRCILFLNIKIN